MLSMALIHKRSLGGVGNVKSIKFGLIELREENTIAIGLKLPCGRSSSYSLAEKGITSHNWNFLESTSRRSRGMSGERSYPRAFKRLRFLLLVGSRAERLVTLALIERSSNAVCQVHFGPNISAFSSPLSHLN